jgi:hypothetical protein
MPYIKREARVRIANNGGFPSTWGEVNYFITALLVDRLGENPKYADFNAAIGALECAKLELYRKMVAVYEDKKCAENGDVYP